MQFFKSNTIDREHQSWVHQSW